MTPSTTTNEISINISASTRSKMRTLSISSGIMVIIGIYGDPAANVQIFDTSFDGLTPVVIVAACFVINVYTAIATWITLSLDNIISDISLLEDHIAEIESSIVADDSAAHEPPHPQSHNLGALRGTIQTLRSKIQPTKTLYLVSEIYLPAIFSALCAIFGAAYLWEHRDQIFRFS